MASVIYQNQWVAVLENTIDLETDNLDCNLVMNTSTCFTQHDVTAWSGFTTNDESDATGYAAEDVTNPAVTADDTDNEVVWDSDNWVWSGLGGDASRAYMGAVLVKYVDGGANDLPLYGCDFTSDVPLTATQVTAPSPAEGFINIGQPA
jgi:hypothetical protein